MPVAFHEFIVLPVEGSPFVLNGLFKADDKKSLPVLQKAVEGYIEEFSRKDFVVHPLFCESNPRWALAERIRKLSKTKVYVNDDGRNLCSVNVGTIISEKMRFGGCPHLFGNVVLVAYQSDLAKAGISTADLRKRDEEEEDEDDDDDDADTTTA